MKIDIQIEIKPGTARRIAVVGVTLLIVAAAMGVQADQLQFSAGQTLTAANLNNNFNELYAKTAKPTRTLNGRQISVNGVRCGATSPTNGGFGSVLSYLAGKFACETQCGSSTAHMCTADEMVRTHQLGGVLPLEEGWISTGLVFSQGNPVNDCAGWTVGENIRYGTAFYQHGLLHTCDTQLPILCCD